MQTRITALDAIATTDSEVFSDPIDIGNADKINIMLTRGNHVAGNTVFKVYIVGEDGIPTLIQTSQLIDNIANANTETQVMSGSITL